MNKLLRIWQRPAADLPDKPYGLDLWANYGDAFNPANDYGKETMFVSDHSKDPKYGCYTVGGGASGGAAQNLTPWVTH